MKEETIDSPNRSVDFDPDKFAQLMNYVLAGRKIEEVKTQTGLSRSTISKLKNGNAKSKPTEDTLRKLAGGEQNALYWKMLEACGGMNDVQARMQNFKGVMQNTSLTTDSTHMVLPWSSATAFAIVANSFRNGGHRKNIQFDYRDDGVFAVDMGDSKPLMVFVPIVAENTNPETVVGEAEEGLANGMTWWGISNVVYILLTNSRSVYELMKAFPNPTKTMAVALAPEGGSGFVEHTVIPATMLKQKQRKDLPIDLGFLLSGTQVDNGECLQKVHPIKQNTCII